MDWRTFWNEDHAIYVNARHRTLHADLVARGLLPLLPTGHPHVLDWGCGEAEAADLVAARCGLLYLYDSAPRVQRNLRLRYGTANAMVVLDEDSLRALPNDSLDTITIVSVIQYLSRDGFGAALAALTPKLRIGGRMIVADVIPPGLSPLVDAKALLSFGRRGGFLFAAIAGLMKTFFSNYRTLRSTLGISQWSEDEMRSLLGRHGLNAQRTQINVGHNQARMTFVATRVDPGADGADP